MSDPLPELRHHFATLQDVPLLATWNAVLIRDEDSRTSLAPAELRSRMAGWLAADGGYRAVIFTLPDGEFAGYALYRAEAPREIFIRQLVIAPAHRRLGLGRRCVQLLAECYWPADARLTVDVLSQNAAGLAFWRSTGFADYFVRMERLPAAGQDTK